MGRRADLESKMMWTTLMPGRGLEAQGILERGRWGLGRASREVRPVSTPEGREGGGESFLTHIAFLKCDLPLILILHLLECTEASCHLALP